MLSQELLDQLEFLRCPLDPRNRLSPEDDRLVCARCGLRFLIKDGFPKLIAEDAELPPGCEALDQLPCQREPKGPPANP
jgi:uncharacterized protein YbaR (Trm112 family)